MGTLTGNELSYMGTRAVFNRTLRHIVNVTNQVEAVSKGANLADILQQSLAAGAIERSQITPIVSAVLINKFQLPYRSMNMANSLTDFTRIIETTARWNGLDFTIIYHQPNVGAIAINPANPDHWADVHDLKQNELIVVYCRHKKGKDDKAASGLNAFFELLAGGSPADDPDYIIAQAAAPAPKPRSAPAGKKNLTPKYSVQVTNELFHNGNVEAWKNIIESYETKYDTLQCIVYHEGELIQDLNSLFKWGKVKHGGVIFIQVAGDQIKGVSRLQKYLFEGASPRFEAFLKHDVNKVLNLF